MERPQTGGKAESKTALLPVAQSTNLPFEFSSRALNISGYITGITGLNSSIQSISANGQAAGSKKSFSFSSKISEITHDLSNTLSVIISGVDLAKYGLEPEDEICQNLEQIENSGLRARDLIHRLQVHLSGIDESAEKPSITNFIEETVADVLKDTSVKCEFSLPDDLLQAETDQEQLKRAIKNIIIHSLRNMSFRGELQVTAVNLKVGEKDSLPLPAGAYLQISISDEGLAIPYDKIKEIFETHQTRQPAAWGLGLAITKEIISGLGGFIDVQPRKGGGSTFHIYLQAVENEEKSENMKAAIFKEQGRVLVMDDMPEVRNIVSQILRRLGHEVDSSHDGAETVKKYKQAMKAGRKYDVVILDLNIPEGMGAEDTLRELLKLDPAVNALISSGCHNADMITNYEKFGFHGFVTKPFTVDELSRAVSNTFLMAGYSAGIPYC